MSQVFTLRGGPHDGETVELDKIPYGLPPAHVRCHCDVDGPPVEDGECPVGIPDVDGPHFAFPSVVVRDGEYYSRAQVTGSDAFEYRHDGENGGESW